MSNLISLFDYLGRAAGSDLGAQVAKYSKSIGNTEVGTRHVENKTYKGPVNLYSESFLDNFFKNPMHENVIAQDKQAYVSKIMKKHATKKASNSEDKLPF